VLKTLSFGEILWDIIDGQAYIGGAPFNVAAHFARMGAESYMISAVGDDVLGTDALKSAQRLGVDTRFVAVTPGLATGTVDVRLSANGQPAYTINEGTAWDAIPNAERLCADVSAGTWDVFCFGTLAQRTESNRTLLEAVRSAARAKQVVYDVNLRGSFYDQEWIERSLHAASVLKINEDESELVGDMLFGQTEDIEGFCRAVSERYKIPTICVTQGAEGAAIWVSGSIAWIPAYPATVVDTVGAGDAFTAALLWGMESGKTTVEATKIASKLGAWVASQRGAVPDYSAELKAVFKRP
jgi:fructokinase